MAMRVASWYDANVDLEDRRLEEGRLEYAISLQTLLDLRGKLPALDSNDISVIDVGCGTGRYAIELAQRGYKVTISDVSSRLLHRAQEHALQNEVAFEHSYHCDARKLSSVIDPQQNSFHISLALGPLYHILDPSERCRLLSDLIGMTKPGGFVAAAFVNRNAHLRDVCAKHPTRLQREYSFYQKYLQDGIYTRGSGPSMYHATLQEIEALLDDTRQAAPPFALTKIVACEGFLGFRHAANLAKLNDTEFQRWFDIILQSCEDETNFGASDHLLVVLQRMG